ncbi:hypothetical protein ACO1O0_006701 [Amphichorda felina]
MCDFESGDLALPELHDQSDDTADHETPSGPRNKPAPDLLNDPESGDLALPQLRYRPARVADQGEATAIEPQFVMGAGDNQEPAQSLAPSQGRFASIFNFFSHFRPRAADDGPLQPGSPESNEMSSVRRTPTQRKIKRARRTVNNWASRTVEAFRKGPEYYDSEVDDETGIDPNTGRERRQSIIANASPDLHPSKSLLPPPDDMEKLPPGLFIADPDTDPDDNAWIAHTIYRTMNDVLSDERRREEGDTFFDLTPSEWGGKVMDMLSNFLYWILPLVFGGLLYLLVKIQKGDTPLPKVNITDVVRAPSQEPC